MDSLIRLYEALQGLILFHDDGLTGSPGKSQKEGQEKQASVKELGGPPILFLRLIDAPEELDIVEP